MDFLSNLINTSGGNFFKNTVSNIGKFLSGNTSDSKENMRYGMRYLGWDEGFISPDISSKSNSDKFSEYGKLGHRYHVGKYTSGFGFFTNIKDKIAGFKYYKAAKGSKLFDVGKKIWSVYDKSREKRQAITKAFPTAVNKTSLEGSDASSMTPGYGFAAKANRRDAFRNNQVAQAAIEAALANIKIQNAMLSQIKGTKPTITLNSINNSINTRLSRRA